MKHRHHIIPKHRGGTDDPSNLVEISLTQHAMFHYCEWKLYGKRADYVAWKRLVGNLNDEELVHQKLIMGGENGGRKTKELGIGIFAMSKERRSEVSKRAGKIGGEKCRDLRLGIFSLSKEKRLEHSRKNILKAIEKAREAGVFDYEMSRERGIRGNKSQREKFAKMGKKIGEQKWEVTKPDGETIVIENMAKFCLEHGLQKSKMTLVSQGERKQHKGYKCRKITGNVKEYEGDFSLFEWEVTAPNNEVFVIENLKTFCIENNLKEGMMYRVGRGERKHHKGYKVRKVVKRVKNYLDRLE